MVYDFEPLNRAQKKQKRVEMARNLRAKRLTAEAISERMGCTTRAVFNYLRVAREKFGPLPTSRTADPADLRPTGSALSAMAEVIGMRPTDAGTHSQFGLRTA